MTLVEVLVVLALIGVMSGVAALSVGGGRNDEMQRAVDLLSARLALLSEETILTGRPSAFRWNETGYDFMTLEDGDWGPLPRPGLDVRTDLPGGVRILTPPGDFILGGDAVPMEMAPLRLSLGRDDGDASGATILIWDGMSARPEGAG